MAVPVDGDTATSTTITEGTISTGNICAPSMCGVCLRGFCVWGFCEPWKPEACGNLIPPQRQCLFSDISQESILLQNKLTLLALQSFKETRLFLLHPIVCLLLVIVTFSLFQLLILKGEGSCCLGNHLCLTVCVCVFVWSMGVVGGICLLSAPLCFLFLFVALDNLIKDGSDWLGAFGFGVD